jgi:hypothetical protein
MVKNINDGKISQKHPNSITISISILSSSSSSYLLPQPMGKIAISKTLLFCFIASFKKSICNGALCLYPSQYLVIDLIVETRNADEKGWVQFSKIIQKFQCVTLKETDSSTSTYYTKIKVIRRKVSKFTNIPIKVLQATLSNTWAKGR